MNILNGAVSVTVTCCPEALMSRRIGSEVVPEFESIVWIDSAGSSGVAVRLLLIKVSKYLA